MECAREVERVINWEMPETVAGVIIEVIITGGGILVPPDGYVEEVARICERTGALLIVDEVGCGFGRTGKKFGYHHHEGVKPDIVTVGKGMTSGYLPCPQRRFGGRCSRSSKGRRSTDAYAR